MPPRPLPTVAEVLEFHGHEIGPTDVQHRDIMIMDLRFERGCVLPDTLLPAMQRGLDAVGQPDTVIVVSNDFDQTIRRLDHASHMYTAERGSGVAAARTMMLGGTPTIILNGGVVSRCSTADVELLMAQLGYPVAERANAGSLDEQLLELSFTVCTALTDPACANPRVFAKTMIEAMQLMATSLAYLAGANTGGTHDFDVSQLSAFGPGFREDAIAPSWPDRLNLYGSIPSAGTHESPAILAGLLNRAVEVERNFLSDIGFTITEDECQPGAWSFHRTGSDAVFDARIQQLASEARQRGLAP